MEVSQGRSPSRAETSTKPAKVPYQETKIPKLQPGQERGETQKWRQESTGDEEELRERGLGQQHQRSQRLQTERAKKEVLRGKGKSEGVSDFNKDDNSSCKPVKLNVSKNFSTRTKFNKRSLKILTSNICGLKSKKASLMNILNTNNVDIACVSETHCEKDTIPELPGYVTYHRNRITKSKGGIAIFLKKEFEHHIMKLESGSLDNEFFVCKLSCFEPQIVLVLQYGVIENRYSNAEIFSMQSEIFNIIRGYTEEGFDLFWTGDMNVHLGNDGKLSNNNPKVSVGGRNLNQFIENENLHMCNWDNNSHTHWDRSGGTSNILDIMITNANDKVTEFKVDTKLEITPFRVRKVKGGLSRKYTDHLSLLTTIQVQGRSTQVNKLVQWNYFKANGDKNFHDEMELAANQLAEDVENRNLTVDQIHSRLIKRINNIKHRVYGKTSVTQKKAQEMSDYALWQKRLKEVEKSIHSLNKFKITDRIWEMRNNISYKFKDKQFVSVTDPRTGNLTKSKEETFDAILDYNFELLRKDKNITSDEVAEKERIKDMVTQSGMNSDTNPGDGEFTRNEMHEVMEKVKVDNKNVYWDVLKSGPIFRNALLNFFNRCYKDEQIPKEWDETTLMKLYKNKGKRTDLKMNRFIHLKPFMPKLFEKLVMKKVESRLADKTPEFQIGGRKKSSTTEHLLTLMMYMKRLEKDNGGGICQFMDIRTCFDKMTLKDSLYECAQAGIVGKPLRTINNITDNLKIRIQGDCDTDRVKELKNCLGQGTGYAPTGTGVTMASTLETNMANKEAETVVEDEDFTLAPIAGPIAIQPLLFVDDMNKTCLNSKESKIMGEAITETLDELKMQAHDEKSGLLIFGKNKALFKEQVESNPTYIQGFKMGFKEQETYLGMQFAQSSNDSITLTLETRRMKCYLKAQELRRKLEDDRVQGVGWLATAITVFNASIVSTLTYGCGAWIGMLKKHQEHIEQTHRQCLYTVLDVSNRSNYRNLLSTCKIMPAIDMIKKLQICFINDLVHMKQSGICYETLTAEYNRGELRTLRDEVSDHCEYFGVRDVNEYYLNPTNLKKQIYKSSMDKLWLSLLSSKKAPWAPRREGEKDRFYHTLPKHQAKCTLLYEAGELNFRANRKYESLKRYGSIECVVPGCHQDDTLEHALECYGYSTKFKEGGSPHEWAKFLSDLDVERFRKYRTSLTRFNT